MRVLRTLFLLMSVASCPFVMSGKAAKTAKSHVDEVSMMIGTDGRDDSGRGFAFCHDAVVRGDPPQRYIPYDVSPLRFGLNRFYGDASAGHLDGRLRVHDPDAPKWRTENQGDGQAGASGAWERSGYTLLFLGGL